MSITIAPARLADIPSLRDCVDIVSRQTRFLASTQAPSEAALETSLLKTMDNDSVQMVAREGPRVVAWAHIERAAGTLVRHRGDLDIGVLPDFQGHGIGKRLLRECIAAAQAKGIDRIELEVRTDNRGALALYCQTGFAVESIVRKAMKVDGLYHDTFRMSLVPS